MTSDCIKRVLDLQNTSESFCDLTVEQLLYAAIVGTSLSDVEYVLVTTDWEEYGIQTGSNP